ncbi:unnamed protein product, partial [Staurois parvus]
MSCQSAPGMHQQGGQVSVPLLLTAALSPPQTSKNMKLLKEAAFSWH